MSRLWRRLTSSLGAMVGLGAMALAYALAFLWLTGDLAGGGSGLEAGFPAWERLFERRGFLRFEPVGWIVVGGWVWTFSPLNTLLALGLGILLGLNLLAAWWVWRSPRACGLGEASTSLLASIPALLLGGACCAPLVLIWLGLPLAGAVAGVMPILLPLAVVAMLVGLWRLARRLDRPP